MLAGELIRGGVHRGRPNSTTEDIMTGVLTLDIGNLRGNQTKVHHARAGLDMNIRMITGKFIGRCLWFGLNVESIFAWAANEHERPPCTKVHGIVVLEFRVPLRTCHPPSLVSRDALQLKMSALAVLRKSMEI